MKHLKLFELFDSEEMRDYIDPETVDNIKKGKVDYVDTGMATIIQRNPNLTLFIFDERVIDGIKVFAYIAKENNVYGQLLISPTEDKEYIAFVLFLNTETETEILNKSYIVDLKGLDLIVKTFIKSSIKFNLIDMESDMSFIHN